jgi:hypothetical protein
VDPLVEVLMVLRMRDDTFSMPCRGVVPGDRHSFGACAVLFAVTTIAVE